ncbi:MAG: methionyl-tRNA formyltransferase [Aerococcus sp.]|nr:methionyl-tRNA formyltransferase [Aerococcus sp.]
MKKIMFMGTPAFSVKPLEALIASPHYEVVGVVTQPDRPVGRKHRLQPSPVKKVAVAHDIPVFQPERISRDHDIPAFIAEKEVDLIVTAAFGQFLPMQLLELPTEGAINVHASLLPKYRGGAPVHYAIWQGEKETGVTIMRMVKQMDAGNIITQRALPIEATDTVAILFDKLSELGTALLLDTLPLIFNHEATETPQVEEEATYSPAITRAQERIDWQDNAEQIERQIRAFNSWPVAHTVMGGVRYKLWGSRVLTDTTTATPGTIIQLTKKPAQLAVACGEGSVLSLTEIQPAGKKAMPIASFINGGSGGLTVGDRFESRGAHGE